MRFAVGADHAGFVLKERLGARLSALGHQVQDFGTHSEESCDYPDFAQRVARAVAGGEADAGLLICGTGIGMSITANRFRGVRAARCCSVADARLAREHNNANVLCLGGRVLEAALAEQILDAFLSAQFAGGRHARRVAKIDADS